MLLAKVQSCGEIKMKSHRSLSVELTPSFQDSEVEISMEEMWNKQQNFALLRTRFPKTVNIFFPQTLISHKS